MSSMAVPLIDISQFLHGSAEARSTFAKQLVAGFREYGAVRLLGNSISPSATTGLFDWTNKYFGLPVDFRRKYVSPDGLRKPSRGYRGLDEEKTWKLSPATAGLSDAKELRESFDMGPPADSSFPTPWPDECDLPGFRQYMESQYEAFQKLALQLIQAAEMGLQVPEGKFTERCLPDGSELRLNYYPAVTSQRLDAENTRRIWPHTDTGLFSFVFQGTERGLQLEDRKNPGRFVPVLQEGSDELIVTVSSTLERWTNGILPACVHQVAATDEQKVESLPPRRSIVFFFRASGNKSSGPFPQFVSNSRPTKYDEITVAEYNQRRNNLQYS